MKRIATAFLLIALLLCFSLTACSTDSPTATQSPLTFQNTESKGVLTLGMSRQDAEKVLSDDPSTLTQPLQWSGSGTITYFPNTADQLTIYYDHETVAWFTVDQNDATVTSHWAVNDGLSRGAEEAAVIEQYGQALPQNRQTDADGILHLSYYYDEEGQLLGEENGSAAYVVLLELDQGKLIGYQVSSTTIQPVKTSVGFLLSQDNPTSEDGLEGTFSIRTGSWDLNTGTFQYEETPVLEATGPERNSQLFSWNGADQYLIGDQDAVTAASDSVDLVSWVPLYDHSHVCWGPGYQLLVSLEDPAQITLEREDTDPVTVTLPEPPADEPLADLFLLSHTLEGDQLTLVYGAMLTMEGGQEDLLLTVAVDLASQQAQWGDPVSLPQAYSPHFFPPAHSWYYPVVDGKLYFSTGDSAAYFDLSAGTFTALEDLPQRLEALFPGAERAENTAGGGVFPAEPMGATEEVAIFAFLYEGRNVWVALRDEQVLGVLEQSLENNTITCYDSAFQQTSQVELPFSLYNLQPQASVSPFPL